jgi:predicted TIM-barrel fold metal-dependent hydrolase
MIDIHTHCLLPEHWGREYPDHWEPVVGRPWRAYSVEEFDEAMAGVEAAVVFGIKATRAGVNTPHEDVARFCAAAKTPSIGLMALDPLDPDVLEQLQHGVALGLQGIKLYPVLAGFRADDPVCFPLYAEAERRGLPLLWHMGATPSAAGDLALTQPILIDAVARRYPDLRQIIAHMGHPWFLDTIMVLRKAPNVYADVSGAFARSLGGYHAFVHAQEWGVTHKLLFGSDWPFWTPAESAALMRGLAAKDMSPFPNILPETMEAIIARDSLALLGLRLPAS